MVVASVDDPPKEILPRLRADADYFGLSNLVEHCDRLLLKPPPSPRKPATPKPHYSYQSTTRIDDFCYPSDWKLVKVIPPVADDKGFVTKQARFVFERVVEK